MATAEGALSGSAARVSVTSATAFLALLALLHLVRPELDPSWRMVSEYAIGSYGWLMVLAFFSLSLSCLSSAVALRSQVGRFGPSVPVGWPNRLLVVAYCAWLIAGRAPGAAARPAARTRSELESASYLDALSAAR
jgi:hypothetical protein